MSENVGVALHALSVSRFVELTDEVLQGLGTACVIGEISELYPRSHLYFKLKDDNASVDCLMWGNLVRQLAFTPQAGMLVQVTGNSSLYRKNGQFKLLVRSMQPAGQGHILERLEQLKRRLEAEGIFARPKKAIPRFVDRVGIITSGEGRVLHDICITLARRNPLIEVKLYAAAVQGREASASLCQALRQAYADRVCDVLIICRGGGSFEDLLPFSDEAVVRLTAQSPLPIISAVGHEPDTALTDFAADLRAATPTAAAEIVSFYPYSQLQQFYTQLTERLHNLIMLQLDERDASVERLQLRLQASGPLQQIQLRRSRVAQLEQQLQHLLVQALQVKTQRLQYLQQALLTHNLERRLGADKERLSKCTQQLDILMAQSLQGKFNALQHVLQQLIACRLEDRLQDRKQALAHMVGRLSALNPLDILQRGYSVTRDLQGKLLNIHEAFPGQWISTQIAGGEVISRIEELKLTN